MLADLTLADFARETGSVAPAPGGGSVAATCGCLAASLIAMVCRLRIAKGGDAGDHGDCQALLEEADGLSATLLEAVDRDTEAYQEVVAAFRLPKREEAERVARHAAIQAATVRAAEVPLETARCCHQAILLATRVWPIALSATASDLGVALQAARAGLQGAALNVQINLSSLDDQGLADTLRDALVTLVGEGERLFEATYRDVRLRV